MKPGLLFLVHRIPYPPNKGDKIRSYHLLEFLSRHYRVYLGTFIDDENDWQYVSKVEALCEESLFVELNTIRAKLKSLFGFFNGKPLTLPYYANEQLQNWIKGITDREGIQKVLVFSSAMAQFVENPATTYDRRVIDFVDIDSDKWRQYADNKSWPMSWIYRRESSRLLEYERNIAARFDASLFVSSTEANHFKQLAPEVEEKVAYYNNGVDAEYFSPDPALMNPYPMNKACWVFTGAMDYWANVDAVVWFVDEVWPAIRQLSPGARFYVVGSNPTEVVNRLASRDGVHVTGRVDDIRCYLQHATAVVAPMRIARGIQNKVLEGMAMEKPVVVSSLGLEGICAENGEEVLVADDAEQYVRCAQSILDQEHLQMGQAARARVVVDFNWSHSLPIVSQLLDHIGQSVTQGVA